MEGAAGKEAASQHHGGGEEGDEGTAGKVPDEDKPVESGKEGGDEEAP